MKKLISLVVTVFAIALAGFSLAGCSTGPIVDKVLAETANELNKNVPMTVDAETRLDNVSALPNQTMRYSYTLVNFAKSDLDEDMLTQMQDTMKPSILNLIKTSSDMKSLRDLGVTFEYLYRSNDSQELFKLAFGPSDYK